jgi:isoaspartyl peptidase/L-asparaginase-like protein (Ntn-hydrolase superfamily)
VRACSDAISMMRERVDGLGGLIMVDARGRIGYHHNTPRMAFGVREGGTGDTRVAIKS